MATLCPARSRSAGGEVESIHVLAEFVEEDSSTAVVPLQRVLDLENLDCAQAGEKITVLWYDGKKYPAVFLTSGTKTFCLSEEKKMIDEYSDSSGYDPSSEEDEEGDMQDECRSQENNDSTEEQESAVGKQGNVGGEKMKKKQKQHKSKRGQSKGSRKANKENIKNSDTNKNEDFIVRIGRIPMRSLPLDVTGISNQGDHEETVRKDLEPYTGQTVEMYSSDDDNDEFYRCCARIEKAFEENSFGTVNKSMIIPVNGDDNSLRDTPPIHYTSGAQEMEYSALKGSVNTLKSLVQTNEENQRKVNTEIRSDITKINTKIDEANQSLSLILAQLIKPNALHPDGYVTPTATITQPTGVAQFVHVPSSAVTASTSVVNSPSVTQYSSHVPSSPTVIPSTSVVSPVNVAQYANSAPMSPVVTLSVNVVNPTNFANIVPLSPSVIPSSSINLADVTLYTYSIPSSPVVTPTSTVNPAVVSQYASSVPSSPVVSPSANVANVTPSRPIPYCGNLETGTTSFPPETQLPHSGILDSDQIKFIRSGSCSRRNFTARLVVALFDEATRRRSNVSGKLGKSKLNPVLIQYVKSLAFQLYPLEHHENEKGEWSKCVVSIDEVNRRLNKPAKPASTEQRLA